MHSLGERTPLFKKEVILPRSENDPGIFQRQSFPPVVIHILEQPSSTFYKDEGGKSNHMTTRATLLLDSPKHQQRKEKLPGGNVWLKPRLVYESGDDVEDADEIFKVFSVEPNCVSTTDEEVVVKFRIEKVSRRKDGKKFKISFDAQYEESQHRNIAIVSALTEPIIVLSKRKNSINSTGSNPKHQSKKKGKADEASKAKKAKGLQQVANAIKSLERKVLELHQRVSYLESENKALRGRMNDDMYEPLDEYQAVSRVSSDSAKALVEKEQKISDIGFDSAFLIRYDEDANGKHMPARSKSTDLLNFDFGLPSGMAGSRSYFAD